MSFSTDHRADVRLSRAGASALNDTELLALILGDGSQADLDMAEKILKAVDGIEELPRHIDALARIEKIRPEQFNRLTAAMQIARRLMTPNAKRATYIRTAKDAMPYVADMAYLAQEELRVLVLDPNDALLAVRTIYKGNAYQIPNLLFREILAPNVNFNAPGLILAHNHPPLNAARPSEADRVNTADLKRIAAEIDITVKDHLIVHSTGVTSMLTGMAFSFQS